MTRADLEYIRILNDQITGGLLHIAELKSKAYPGAIIYDDSGASKPAPTNKLEEVFCMIDREERRVNRLIDKRYALRTQAIREIRAVFDDDHIAERHILYLRYLTSEPLEWSEIIRYVNRYHNIHRSRIYEIHHIAIKKLERYHI